MKLLVITSLIFCFISSAISQEKGVALFDYKNERPEYKTMNRWVRNHMISEIDDTVLKVQDTVFGDSEDQAVSFVQFRDQSYGFVKFDIDLDPMSAIFRERIALSETNFRIDLDLVGRKLVMTDSSEHELKMVFPLAHGGLNMMKTKIMTPQFRTAYINKATIISERTNPSYYQGLPFLRVMTNTKVSKGWTGIGIHIKQNSSLKRSPDSHGCIRLRKWDLMTAHNITKFGPRQFTPLTIHLTHAEDVLHPTPMYNRSFKKIKNFGTKSNPFSQRDDKHGLTIFETVYESPIPYIEDMVSRI